MSNYLVSKMVKGVVFYKVPNENRERVWKGENAKLRIPFQELEDCMYDAAIRTLFEEGYLWVEDQEARVLLGLENPEQTETDSAMKLIFDAAALQALLYNNAYAVFETKMDRIADASLENLFDIAINSGQQLSHEKSDYIRKKYHVDIDMIQRNKREEKEE